MAYPRIVFGMIALSLMVAAVPVKAAAGPGQGTVVVNT